MQKRDAKKGTGLDELFLKVGLYRHSEDLRELFLFIRKSTVKCLTLFKNVVHSLLVVFLVLSFNIFTFSGFKLLTFFEDSTKFAECIDLFLL